MNEVFVLTLHWTCQQCGWECIVDAPGFAGDGHFHYPDGETMCGPIAAQRAILNATPEQASADRRSGEAAGLGANRMKALGALREWLRKGKK